MPPLLPALCLALSAATACAASAQLTLADGQFLARGLQLREAPAQSSYRLVDGPRPDTPGFAKRNAPFLVHATLPTPLAGRGSLTFWLRTDRAFASGRAAETFTQKILTLPGALTVSLQAEKHSVTLVAHWDGDRELLTERHLRVILPELPGPAWLHVALHWDGAKGISNAFLNGTPYYVVGEPMAPFPIASSRELIAHIDRFALADLRVEPTPFDPATLPDLVGPAHLGTLARLLGAQPLPPFDATARRGPLLYQSSLATPADTRGWILEGPGLLEPRDGWLHARSSRPDGPQGHLVYWCPQIFPDRFVAEWEFELLEPKGLCIVFFGARGHHGKDLFDPTLKPRDGVFAHYTNSDLDAYHISYFANTPAVPRAVANLRKNAGFFCLSNGPVGVSSGRPGTIHRALLLKDGPRIQMSVDGRTIIDYTDDGQRAGPVLTDGRIGLRQMQWTVARYRHFRVHALR